VQGFAADLAPLAPPLAIAPEAVCAPHGALIAGDGALRIKPHLEGRSDLSFAHGDGIVDAAVVAAIAAERGASGPVSPLYLRPPDVTMPRSVA
jgi:tRNA threonylcarbamoyladenosine biosynthesis protein TsaB